MLRVARRSPALDRASATPRSSCRSTVRPCWSSTSRTGGRTWSSATVCIVRRNVYAGVVEAARDAGLAGGRIGLLDEERMTVAALRAVSAGLPRTALERADEIAMRRRMIKSHAEIEMMRQSSRISGELMSAMFAEVADGTHRRRSRRRRVRARLPPRGAALRDCDGLRARKMATCGGRACPAGTGAAVRGRRHRPSRHLRRRRRLLLRLRPLDRRRRRADRDAQSADPRGRHRLHPRGLRRGVDRAISPSDMYAAGRSYLASTGSTTRRPGRRGRACRPTCSSRSDTASGSAGNCRG